LQPGPNPVTTGSFPNTRLRRTRQADWIRRMVRETRIDPAQLIQPLFVAEGKLVGPVASMPGVERLSLTSLGIEVRALYKLGIAAIALFPVIPADKKNPSGD